LKQREAATGPGDFVSQGVDSVGRGCRKVSNGFWRLGGEFVSQGVGGVGCAGGCRKVSNRFPGGGSGERPCSRFPSSEIRKDQDVSPQGFWGEGTLVLYTSESIMTESRMSRGKEGVSWLERFVWQGVRSPRKAAKLAKGRKGVPVDGEDAGLGCVPGCQLGPAGSMGEGALAGQCEAVPLRPLRPRMRTRPVQRAQGRRRRSRAKRAEGDTAHFS